MSMLNAQAYTSAPTFSDMSNVLVMSASPAFRQEIIRQTMTIAQRQRRGGKVLFICGRNAPLDILRQYQPLMPQLKMLAVEDLEIVTSPSNTPFVACRRADVLFVTPRYLQRQLMLRSKLHAYEVFDGVDLLVIDDLDDTLDPTDQAVLELGIVQLYLYRSPLETKPRVIVTTQFIANHQALATWLRAETITDATMPADPGRLFVSAWRAQTLTDVIAICLAWYQAVADDHLCAFIQKGFATTETAFYASLAELHQKGLIMQFIDQNSDRCCSTLTRMGKAMALHCLKSGTVSRLQAGLKHGDLTWLDMLLLAGTFARFSEVLSLSPAEAVRFSPLVGKLRSTYLRQPLAELATQLNTTTEGLGHALKVALVGYLVTRGNSPGVIGETLGLAVEQVYIVTLALQRLLQAMVVLTYDSNHASDLFPLKVQALANMLLTPVGWQHLGLITLPEVPVWAIDELLVHNITNLTTLCVVPSYKLENYRFGGLLKMLQRHAIKLLADYENEAAYLAAFTNGVAPLGDTKTLLAMLAQ